MTATKNPFDIINKHKQHRAFELLTKFSFPGDTKWAAEKIAQTLTASLINEKIIKEIAHGHEKLTEQDEVHKRWRTAEKSNYFVLIACEAISKIITKDTTKLLTLDRAEIDDLSKEAARRVQEILRRKYIKTQKDLVDAIEFSHEVLQKMYSINIKTKNIQAALLKLTDNKALRRAMLRQSKRAVAEVERKLLIALRAAHKIDIVQDTAYKIQKKTDELSQKFIENAVLKQKDAENNEIALKDVVEKAKNAQIAELVALITGIKKYSEKRAWTSALITLTLQSEFHATTTYRSSFRRINPKFNDASINQSWKKLHEIHEKVRKFASKHEIECLGVAAPQPHGDGTPHLHIYISADKEDLEIIINKYKELNTADERRTDIKYEDRKKGSLSSYMIRYALREVNNENDKTGAWYKIFSIRRFNFFGTSSARSLWKALQKLKNSKSDEAKQEKNNFIAQSEVNKQLFNAVERGDFAELLLLLKKHNIKGKFVYEDYENQYTEISKRLSDKYEIRINNVKQFIKFKFFNFEIVLSDSVEKVIDNYPSESYALKNTEMNTQNVTNDTEKITSPE